MFCSFCGSQIFEGDSVCAACGRDNAPEVNIPAIIDNGDIDGDLDISVNAYAIQAIGFSNVYEAYAAYVAQE
jgi:hypothetical protein